MIQSLRQGLVRTQGVQTRRGGYGVDGGSDLFMKPAQQISLPGVAALGGDMRLADATAIPTRRTQPIRVESSSLETGPGNTPDFHRRISRLRAGRPARVTRTAHCSMGVILELGVFELYISFNIYIVPAHDVAVWCDDRRGPVEPHRPRRRAPPRSGGVRSEPACGLCREGDPQTGPCSEGASSGGLPWELWVHAAR